MKIAESTPPKISNTYNAFKAFSMAPIVASMISSLCEVETNPASNCDGAKYAPFSRIF